MRSRLLLLFLVITFSGEAQTQAKVFTVGIFAGGLASDVAGFDFFDHDNDFYKAGLTGGAFVNAKISDKNSFQFEMAYVQKGTYTGKADSANNYTYYHLALDYIEVPVLFRHTMHLHIHAKESDHFSFMIGPYFGALVRKKEEGNYYQDGLYVDGLFPDDDFKKADFGLMTGVSYNFLKNFYFDVRYSNSLTRVTRSNAVSNQFIIYSFNQGHNMVFDFTLRYLFGKKPESE